MLDWKWYLSDIVIDKPVSVFSTFSCGGGSSMGYKRAGFNVIGNVEIDPRVNELYVKNLHPKYNYLMDLRDFNKLENLPEELYQLDILDGSPPCSTFSLAGDRDKSWGKEKVFREGQKKQTLDDLFFVFLDTVEKLRPKIVVAENVPGMVMGKARGYVNEIIKTFKELGYDVQLFKLNAAKMDVPQNRERVFFIANRMNYPKLEMSFNGKALTFGEIRTQHGVPLREGGINKKLLEHLRPQDVNFGSINKRVRGRWTGASSRIIRDEYICPCIPANGSLYRACDKTRISDGDLINASSFPQDYDFCGSSVHYVVGMSVPPNMTANIALKIWDQWLKKEKINV